MPLPLPFPRDVQFTYPSRPKEKVFRDFNLKVEPGTTVALVSTCLRVCLSRPVCLFACMLSSVTRVLVLFYRRQACANAMQCNALISKPQACLVFPVFERSRLVLNFKDWNERD